MNALKKVNNNTPTYTNLRNDLFYPFEQVFDNFFNDFFRGTAVLDKVKSQGSYPKIDFFESENQYVLQAAIPGVKPDDVEVEMVNEAIVSISGKISTNEEYTLEAQHKTYIRELTKRAFSRQVNIGEPVGEPKVASIKDGILTLKWDKIKNLEPQKKLVPITVE